MKRVWNLTGNEKYFIEHWDGDTFSYSVFDTKEEWEEEKKRIEKINNDRDRAYDDYLKHLEEEEKEREAREIEDLAKCFLTFVSEEAKTKLFDNLFPYKNMVLSECEQCEYLNRCDELKDAVIYSGEDAIREVIGYSVGNIANQNKDELGNYITKIILYFCDEDRLNYLCKKYWVPYMKEVIRNEELINKYWITKDKLVEMEKSDKPSNYFIEMNFNMGDNLGLEALKEIASKEDIAEINRLIAESWKVVESTSENEDLYHEQVRNMFEKYGFSFCEDGTLAMFSNQENSEIEKE